MFHELTDGDVQIENNGFHGPDDIVLCNIDDESSLVAAFATSKIVLNCTGPYRFLGERCVRAALTAGTNIMDISGEPQVKHALTAMCANNLFLT